MKNKENEQKNKKEIKYPEIILTSSRPSYINVRNPITFYLSASFPHPIPRLYNKKQSTRFPFHRHIMNLLHTRYEQGKMLKGWGGWGHKLHSTEQKRIDIALEKRGSRFTIFAIIICSDFNVKWRYGEDS